MFAGNETSLSDEPDLITLGDAQRRLGISHTTMARLVKEGRFTLYRNPLDGRQKLVDAGELTEFLRPQRITDRRTRTDGRVRLEQSNELLRLFRDTELGGVPGRFVVTREAIVHPGLPGGGMPVSEDVFNSLLVEGYVRVHTEIIHRIGEHVGREFILTERGREAADRQAGR